MSPLPPAPRFCPRCGRALDAALRPGEGCPDDGYRWFQDPKVAVGVLVHDSTDRTDGPGRLLLVKRNHDPAAGAWAFPSGYVDAGEVLEEAAVREVREETGVDVRLDRLLGAWSEPGEAVVFLAYAGTHTGGVATAGPEAEEVRWFDVDALPPLAFTHDDEIIQACRDGAGAPVQHHSGAGAPVQHHADEEPER
jgi:ADP-ribose pyrophosphatase YjhB (NUDIX family)